MQTENERAKELNNNEHKFNQSKDKWLNLKHTFKTLNIVLIYKENEERKKRGQSSFTSMVFLQT
jgi:hypothetical protein